MGLTQLFVSAVAFVIAVIIEIIQFVVTGFIAEPIQLSEPTVELASTFGDDLAELDPCMLPADTRGVTYRSVAEAVLESLRTRHRVSLREAVELLRDALAEGGCEPPSELRLRRAARRLVKRVRTSRRPPA